VPELDSDPAWRPVAAFVLGYRGHTRVPTSATSAPGAAGAPASVWRRWSAAASRGPLDRRAGGAGRPVAAAW